MEYVRGTRVIEQSATPTVTAGGYTAGDVIGGLVTLTFQTAGGWCALDDIVLVDDADSISSITIHVFNQTPSTIADNAAYAPTEADLKKKVAKVTITSFDTEGSDRWGQAAPNITKKLISLPDNALYFYIVATAAPTFAATDDLYIRVSVIAEGQ
jgi:hypothetical protein